MCVICKEWLKGNLTNDEAFRNLDELADENSTDEELSHYWEVAEKLSQEKLDDQLKK